ALSGSLICLMEIIMILVYYIILPVYKFNGQTLMKKLFGFKVVKTDG
ncbi:MAG TPA: RDD family protein, partial [Clostridiaceae bacterium]|nr:RDD family protein [Clostridiaceae bacterium]